VPTDQLLIVFFRNPACSRENQPFASANHTKRLCTSLSINFATHDVGAIGLRLPISSDGFPGFRRGWIRAICQLAGTHPISQLRFTRCSNTSFAVFPRCFRCSLYILSGPGDVFSDKASVHYPFLGVKKADSVHCAGYYNLCILLSFLFGLPSLLYGLCNLVSID